MQLTSWLCRNASKNIPRDRETAVARPDPVRPGQSVAFEIAKGQAVHNGASQANWDCVIIGIVATQTTGALVGSQSCLATTTSRTTINYITKIFTNWQRAQHALRVKEGATGQERQKQRERERERGKNWIYNFIGQTRKKTSQGQSRAKEIVESLMVTQKSQKKS